MDYANLMANDKTAPKELLQLFKRAGAVVAQSSVGKPKRQNSMSFKPIFLTFADNQTLELRLKTTGDFFQVLLNGKVLPVKHQDDERLAVAEAVAALNANSQKFQAALARKKMDLPQGIKSTVKRKEEVYAARLAELDELIAEVKQKLGANHG